MKTELKSGIKGVKAQMKSFHLFLFSILVTEFFPIPTTYLKPYRLKKMSACTSKRLAKLTIQLLQNMRNDHSFNSFCDTVVKKSTECEFIKDLINPRNRKSPNYSTVHLVEPLAKHKFFTQPHVKIATE